MGLIPGFQYESAQSMKPTIEIEVNGKNRSYPAGVTPEEILRENSDKNGRECLAAELNGVLVDLYPPLQTRENCLSSA